MLVVLVVGLCLSDGRCEEWELAEWRGPESAVQCGAVVEQMQADYAVCVVELTEE